MSRQRLQPCCDPRSRKRSQWVKIAVYGLTAAALVAVIALRSWDRIVFGYDIELVAGSAAFVATIAFLLRNRFPRIASAIILLTTFPLVCLTFVLVSFTAASDRLPLRDALLSQVDHLIAPDFNWPAFALGLNRHPMLLEAGNLIYASPYWQSAALIVLLCVTHRTAVAWRFLLAWTSALAITMAVFAIMPAVGAYSHWGIPHSAVPGIASDAGWRQPAMLALLRRHVPMIVDTGSLVGIVAFPSFHAVAAVLLTRGFWTFRSLRGPVVVLNAAMLVASVPMGSHYVVDILAGVLLGSVCAAMIPVEEATAILSLRRRAIRLVLQG